MNITQITDENGSELLLVDKDTLLGSLDYQEEMATQWLRTIEDMRAAIKNQKN